MGGAYLGFFVPGREGGWNVGRAIAACREQLQEAAIWPNIKAYGEASFERRALLSAESRGAERLMSFANSKACLF